MVLQSYISFHIFVLLLCLHRKPPWNRSSKKLFAFLHLHSPLLLLPIWSPCTDFQLKGKLTVTSSFVQLSCSLWTHVLRIHIWNHTLKINAVVYHSLLLHGFTWLCFLNGSSYTINHCCTLASLAYFHSTHTILIIIALLMTQSKHRVIAGEWIRGAGGIMNDCTSYELKRTKKYSDDRQGCIDCPDSPCSELCRYDFNWVGA